MNLKSLSVRQQIYLLSASMLLNVLIVGAVQQCLTRHVLATTNALGDEHLPAVRAMGVVDMMHDGLIGAAYRALFVSESRDPDQMVAVRDQTTEYLSEIEGQLLTLEQLPLSAQVKSQIESTKVTLTAYRASIQALVTAALDGRRSEAVKMVPALQGAFEGLEKDLESLGDSIERDAQAVVDEAHGLSKTLSWLLWLLMGASVGWALLSSWYSSRALSMSLRQAIERLKREATSVTRASGDLRSASEQLSSASHQQASALQETASSLEETSAKVRKSSDHAQESARTASESATAVERGRKSVSELKDAIQRMQARNEHIAREIETSNQRISEVVTVINEIASKTRVINDIVFQTKLLSFNASVEAARAGEQGKGFAVVAEEVGNLAGMSGNASHEIAQMIEASIQKVESAVTEMKNRVEGLISEALVEVRSATQVAEQAEGVFFEIEGNVKQVNHGVGEIAIAA